MGQDDQAVFILPSCHFVPDVQNQSVTTSFFSSNLLVFIIENNERKAITSRRSSLANRLQRQRMVLQKVNNAQRWFFDFVHGLTQIDTDRKGQLRVALGSPHTN
jgi:hypothetical protein